MLEASSFVVVVAAEDKRLRTAAGDTTDNGGVGTRTTG